jgi:hypothetical protein
MISLVAISGTLQPTTKRPSSMPTSTNWPSSHDSPRLERPVVEGAVLDRHLDLLIERADADHRQVEHDLQPERQLAVDGVEEAQPLLAQGRRGSAAADRSKPAGGTRRGRAA